MFFEFHTRNHAVVNLPGLVTILVLPFARVPLLKLCWQGATTVLPSCACHGEMSPDLYGKCSCPRTIYITTLGQLPAIIVSNGPNQGLCSSKNWSCEVVGSLEFSQGYADLWWRRSGFSHCWFDISSLDFLKGIQDPGLCWRRSGFSHCWFDISRPVGFVSSSMPTTKQWWFCLSWKPPWSC